MQHFPVKIFSPIENKTFTVKHWDRDSRLRRSEAPIDATTPSNESSRYIIAEKRFKLFGEEIPKVIIEAVSFGHLEEFKEYGFDARSANLGELLGILATRINNAELGNYLHIIGIASPTGWDQKVADEISSDTFARNYVSRNVSVCLVDSITGEVFHNPQDKRIAGFIDHFQPEFNREKLQRNKDSIWRELEANGVVGYRDFVKETGEDRRILLKAFYELEKEDIGKTRYIKGMGLVLERG